MTTQTLPDIPGNGAKQPIAAQPADGSAKIRARRLWLCAHGSSNGRYGDTNVAAARGLELPADQVVTISASDADIADAIDLTQQFLFLPNGTSVSITYGI
jgi:hypothetical protein